MSDTKRQTARALAAQLDWPDGLDDFTLARQLRAAGYTFVVSQWVKPVYEDADPEDETEDES